MKNIRLSLLIILFSSQFIFARTYHVLYLGNSLTYVNNVPDLVAQIAMSHGDTIIWDSNTPGGHKILQHSTNPVSLTKISDQKWDIVIIQAQSQETAFPDGQLDVEIYPPAEFLTDSIHRNNTCTRVLFYMPAGWKYGDNLNCSALPEICTYEGQFARIRQTHLNISDSMNAGIIPSGISYYRSRAIDSTINLWSSDNVHPSIKGSYLTALNVYASITKKATVGTTYMPSGVSSIEASYLQNITDTVVFDSLSEWKLDRGFVNDSVDFNVTFNYTSSVFSDGFVINNNSLSNDSVFYIIHLDNESDYNLDTIIGMPADSIAINFLFNDTISFCGKHYVIKQVHLSDCGIDTITKARDEYCSGVEEIKSKTAFNIYPNPCNHYFTIAQLDLSNQSYIVDMQNMKGEVILETRLLGHELKKEINIKSLSAGVYLLRIFNEKEIITKKIIVN